MQDESILLNVKPSVLGIKRREQKLRNQKLMRVQLKKYDDVLRGERALRFPLISLNAQRSMGPYRHVLSQQVVAGIMAIHPPFEKQSTQTITTNSRTKFWRK
jgi:hypothetical protein